MRICKGQQSAHPGFWMRSVQFAGLHRILHCVAECANGIRVNELNRLIIERGDYWTERGEPSRTTLYHCRNTLLHLGALRRSGRQLNAARENPHVTALLDEPATEGNTLSPSAREAFSALVLANRDCYRNFFRLFLPSRTKATVHEFREHAGSVVWQPLHERPGREYELRSELSGRRVLVSAPIEVRSILYGVRDWACKQLRLTGEFFDAGRGFVMFPLRYDEDEDGSEEVLNIILEMPSDGTEWTTVSIRELLRMFSERGGHSVRALFNGIGEFVRAYPGYVSLIPTIPTFKTITATSRKGADFQLGSAFHDSRRRVISHIRFHASIKEDHHAKEQVTQTVDKET